MTEVERSILAQHHKLVKLAKIWRAIARRHLSRITPEFMPEWGVPGFWNADGETDP